MKITKDNRIEKPFNQEKFNIEMRKTLEKFTNIAMKKGMSKEEAFQLADLAMDLVTQGRGEEWLDIAQDAINKISNKENKQ
ncbi:TPA: hypothetical protein QCQ73_005477 [Bacillus cereus]|uniref:hypothetical protein n=1 Tax=Bacillus sp. FSL R9-6406 TaxID=2978207 RepID=UPI0030F7DAF4|nr:hypothetical protein [Bacillus cereus]HDR7176577.1 hypothetical protein [Bacillus cereus]HDR7975524.1 hypothetical protein [Bacillus cereus]